LTDFSCWAFSKDGTEVYGIVHDTTGHGAEYQLVSVNVRSGAQKLIGPVDLPTYTNSVRGFSIHPDGKRALTSVIRTPSQIWMLDGFEAPQSKNWLSHLLHR
jgi:hypothetical protein